MRSTGSGLGLKIGLAAIVGLAAMLAGCASGPSDPSDDARPGADTGGRRTTTYWNNGSLDGGVGDKDLARWAEAGATRVAHALVHVEATAVVLEMKSNGTGQLMACIRVTDPAVCYGASESERTGALFVSLDLAPGEYVFDAHPDGVSGGHTYSIAVTVFYGERPPADFTAF